MDKEQLKQDLQNLENEYPFTEKRIEFNYVEVEHSGFLGKGTFTDYLYYLPCNVLTINYHNLYLYELGKFAGLWE